MLRGRTTFKIEQNAKDILNHFIKISWEDNNLLSLSAWVNQVWDITHWDTTVLGTNTKFENPDRPTQT